MKEKERTRAWVCEPKQHDVNLNRMSQVSVCERHKPKEREREREKKKKGNKGDKRRKRRDQGFWQILISDIKSYGSLNSFLISKKIALERKRQREIEKGGMKNGKQNK